MGEGYVVKDSGQRTEFKGGMVRDVTEGKTDFVRVFDGPMLERWAEHLTAGAKKYPNTDGRPNWMKADGEAELQRFRESAVRHFVQWLQGDTDEDHAAAVFFNINGAEYVLEKMHETPDCEICGPMAGTAVGDDVPTRRDGGVSD